MDSPETFRSLSIVIPTYNERDNVSPLFARLTRVREAWGGEFEVLVVDDCSPDGTADVAERLRTVYGLPVRVLRREGRRSMGRAILEGIEQSHGELVCVMDADLSHPPESILGLLRTLDGADGVVASRYIRGGSIDGWARARRIISWGATALSRPLIRTPCQDPLSGFFLFRRSSLAGLALTGTGNKPLLEILAQRPYTIHEIPYKFRDREHGSSKLGPRGVAGFTLLLMQLSRQSIRGGPPHGPYGGENPANSDDP